MERRTTSFLAFLHKPSWKPWSRANYTLDVLRAEHIRGRDSDSNSAL